MSKHVKKRKFTKEDDLILKQAVYSTPNHNWKEIALKTGKYTARQCRERWNNYINPKLIKTCWTKEEDNTLLQKYKEFGSNWVKIKTFLPGRAVNSIKLRFGVLTSSNRPQISEFDYYYELLKIENLINVHKNEDISSCC